MITSVKEILNKAKEGGYAVGAFNTFNLESTQAIIWAAREMNSPVIVQITEKTLEYAGGRGIFNLIKNEAEFYSKDIPVGIHLDHGKSFEIIQHMVEMGLSSVMYDGSRKKYADNVETTKKVADFCHEKGAAVQGELGSVLYLGENNTGEINWDEYMTDPEMAKEFVEETGIDALAVAIGNAHGFLRERKEPDLLRLQKIHDNVKVPLILHGASDWENGKVTDVIKRGVTCFNVDTAIRLAFMNSLMNSFKDHDNTTFDVRKLMGDTREAMKQVVREKIEFFGSAGKA
jgi:fructose-bisphosphate aldolase class II